MARYQESPESFLEGNNSGTPPRLPSFPSFVLTLYGFSYNIVPKAF